MRLYLAGPDVFRLQPAAHGEVLKALCAAFDFIGLYPLDNAIAPQANGPATAAEIYRQNIASQVAGHPTGTVNAPCWTAWIVPYSSWCHRRRDPCGW